MLSGRKATSIKSDQAALHGVRLKIPDLGLSPLEVKRGSPVQDAGRASSGDEAGAP